MTPVEHAAQVYQSEPCARTFAQDLEAHLLHGYVFSAPAFFVMGRAVKKNAPEWLILRPDKRILNPDAWLVWLCAGDMGEALKHLPYPLPWIGFQRKNVLRWYPAERFLLKLRGVSVKGGRNESGHDLHATPQG